MPIAAVMVSSPTTAGMPNAWAKIELCDVRPPASVTIAATMLLCRWTVSAGDRIARHDDGALRRRHLRRIGSGRAIKVAQHLLADKLDVALRRSRKYSWSMASKRALIFDGLVQRPLGATLSSRMRRRVG